MLWFFDRDAERVSLETLYDSDTGEYVLAIQWPDGRRQTERFDTLDRCRAWLKDFEKRLDDEHFVREGAPVLLPYGWAKKPSKAH